MPEPLLEEPRDLADGYAGLRHLKLDVARPGTGEAARSRTATGGILQTAEFVEDGARDNLPVRPRAASAGGASNGSMTTRREVIASRIMMATPIPITVAASTINSWKPIRSRMPRRRGPHSVFKKLVFGFEGFPLDPQNLRLLTKKCHRLSRDFRVVVRKISGHGCSKASGPTLLESAFSSSLPPSTPPRNSSAMPFPLRLQQCSRMPFALATNHAGHGMSAFGQPFRELELRLLAGFGKAPRDRSTEGGGVRSAAAQPPGRGGQLQGSYTRRRRIAEFPRFTASRAWADRAPSTGESR